MDKEEIKARRRELYWLNREHILERKRNNRRIFYLRHKKEILKQNNIWRRNNKDRINKNRRRVNRELRKYDLDFVLRDNIRKSVSRAIWIYIRTGRIVKLKKYPFIDIKSIINHLKPFPKEYFKYEIDHIRPLCTFDLTKEDEITKSFKSKNIRFVLAKINHQKGAKWEK